jgi:outer membrane protein TolC
MRSGVCVLVAALSSLAAGRVATAQETPTLRLTLEDALSRAVQTSHRLAEARAREAAARAGVAIREAAALPTVAATAS